MKKILILLLLLAAATTIFVGCSLFGEETYSYDTSETNGVCVEITTSDFQLKQALKFANYEVGSCPTADKLGTCEGYTELLGESFDGVYYSTSGLTASSAQSACTSISGTWNAAR